MKSQCIPCLRPPLPPVSPPQQPTPVQDLPPIFEVSTPPLQTPRRNRAEDKKLGSSPPRHFAMAVDSDNWLVPTSQSQDLRPFVISPPRPGGSALLKDTTPKLLRQSQAGSPSDKDEKGIPTRREPPLPEWTAILRTPTKVTGLPRDGKVHIMR